MPLWQQPFFYMKRDVNDNRYTMKKDILIVDGYNVIFDWADLKALSKESLEHARLELRIKEWLLPQRHSKAFFIKILQLAKNPT